MTRTRKTFMRTLMVFSVLALGLAMSGSAAAAPPAPESEHVVFPTGEWPTDVENVQAAVDLGGTVLLKATDVAGRPTEFNFGVLDDDTCGRQVGLQGDVWLRGESVGAASTTIRGGYRPILVGLSAWCGGEFSAQSGHVRVESITFEGSYQAAIDIYKATTAEIVDNRISNVVVRGGIGVGVNVFGGGSQRRVAERVTIADNVFEYAAVGGTFVHGIVLDNVSADVEIARNSIETTQDFSGILIVRQVEGTVRIADNFVAPHPDAPGDGTGIYVYANDLWDDVRASDPVYQIVANRILTEGVGIVLLGQRGSIEAPLIERNHISTLGTPGGPPGSSVVALAGNVSEARVSSNRMDGSAPFGIEIFAFEPGDLAESNTFVGNNLTQFRSDTADLFIDEHARETVVVGRSGTVIDHGSGSQITGMARVDGRHVGAQVNRSWLGEPTIAPTELSLTGTSGTAAYDITPGYRGTLDAAAHGLVPATLQPATVENDPQQDVGAALESGIGVTLHTVSVPVGTRHLRLRLFDSETDGAHDLDLFLFGPSFNLIRSSQGVTAEERVDLPAPPPGDYTVVVHGFRTDGPQAAYTLFTWAVGDAAEGNMTVSVPARAAPGITDTVTINWSALLPDQRYLGAVSYSDGTTEVARTLVSIQT